MDSAAEPRRRALIEVLERDGRIGRIVDVTAWPLSLGRGFDNDLVIDDPHLAPHHAVLQADDAGQVTLLPLPSTNGLTLDGRRLREATALPAQGGLLQLGHTRLRVRLPGEVLAPELPMAGALARHSLVLALCALALMALRSVGQWIELDPGADYTAWLPTLLMVPAVVVGWCMAWALLSKLFQHRFDFPGHLRIALPWMLGIALADMLWPQLCAMLDAPGLWKLNGPLQSLLTLLLVHAHLRHVLPLHRMAVGMAVAAFALVGGAVSLALIHRAHDRYSAAPYMSTLPLPALRLGGTVPASALLQDMEPLAAQLAERVKRAKADDDDDDGDAED